MKQPKKKMNHYERVEHNKLVRANMEQGTGRYLLRNHKKCDLILPRVSLDGKKVVSANEEFIGDTYLMSLVRSNQAMFVKDLQENCTMRECSNGTNRLILDQPDTVTSEGTVERLVDGKDSKRTLNDASEANVSNKKPDVLITEDPIDGVDILLD